jgi:para-nitrobenzyl esterase
MQPNRALHLITAISLILLAGDLFAQSTRPADPNAPVATTKLGKIRGYMDKGISAFKGIQYGEDTAKHRFKPSVPPKAWDGIIDAMEFGPQAPQGGGGGGGRGRRGGAASGPAARGGTQSEDCLYLNVWTPALRDGKKRPVMVYFHGGAYNNGSVNSDLYDGVHLCKRGDVVVVTVNHRLNGFGYLYLAEVCGPEYADSGNVGQLDLVLALQWVRDNIAEFGGDPGNVLIFGQSGGGAKCSTLMAMPVAKGLFHRVITMSGQQITGRTREHANDDARKTLAALGIKPEEIHKINDLTTDQIRAGLNGSWTPVTDGRILPRDPFSPDASPLSANIPMMKGNTRMETAAFFAGAANDQTTWDQVPGLITQNVAQYLGDLKADTIVSEYRKWYPNYSPADVFYESTTAARSWKSMVVEVEARAKQNIGPFYVYQFDWHAPNARPGHASDIPTAFDNIGSGGRGGDPGPTAQKMADLMSESFIAFARTGNPDTPALGHWPTYEMTKRSTMVFDVPSKVVDDPRGEERKLFAPVVYVQPGT